MHKTTLPAKAAALIATPRGGALVFLLLAMIILGPLLLPGYILSLDMLWTPKMPTPDWSLPNAPLVASLWLLGLIVPSMVLQKVVLLAIFWLTGFGMYRLMTVLSALVEKSTPIIAAYAAGQ